MSHAFRGKNNKKLEKSQAFRIENVEFRNYESQACRWLLCSAIISPPPKFLGKSIYGII